MLSGKQLAVITAFVSGLSIFLNKFGVSVGSPTVFTGTKNGLVALGLLAIVFARNELKGLSAKDMTKLASIGLIGGSIPFVMFFQGLALTTAPMAGFLHKSLFVWATILAGIVLKEKIEKRFAIFGVSILLGNALLLGIRSLTIGKGELLVMGATLLWAGEQIISKNALESLTSRQVGLGRMGFGALFIALWLLITGQIDFSYSGNQLSWIFVTSFMLLLYVVSWYAALEKEKVSTVTSILSLGSVITTGLNFIFGGITLNSSGAAGILLLVIGVAGVITLTPGKSMQAQYV